MDNVKPPPELLEALSDSANIIDGLLMALRPFAALLQEHHSECAGAQQVFGINGQNVKVIDLRLAKSALDSVEKFSKARAAIAKATAL